jgi:hypothetical protein
MQLVEINPLDVQRVFPSFYHQDSQFFTITYKDGEVGIYGIKTIDQKVCEISLHVFDQYRYKVPYKTGLKLLLSFPFTIGFAKILISSKEKSVITLLRQCKSLGVKFLQYWRNMAWFEVTRKDA